MKKLEKLINWNGLINALLRIARRSAFFDMWYCRIFYKKDCFQMVFGDVINHNDILHFPSRYQDIGCMDETKYRYLYKGWVVRHFY